MQKIDSIEMLETIYSAPVEERSIWKEIDHINELYRQFIEASPFLILATYGDKGVDCSPRGDPPGFVRVVAPDCIQIPDRRGNNRLDSMRNIIQHPEVGIIFLVPNVRGDASYQRTGRDPGRYRALQFIYNQWVNPRVVYYR